MNELNEIAAAFAKAQLEMQNPGFDSTNPHFRNKFASLAAVRNAVIPVMAKHGIAVAQDLTNVEGGVSCVTIFTHSSGQQMRFGPLVMPASKNDAQGFGSAGTYCKRYALMGAAGVVGDLDDDANAATGKAAAYSTPITPQSNISMIPEEVAFQEAVRMRETLEADIQEDVKALKVLDGHDRLVKNSELYQAASAVLKPAERSSWKQYVKMAQAKEKEDRATAPTNGRRW